MNLYNIEKLHFMLNESRGMIDNYYEIGEEIYNKLNSIKPQLLDSECGLYVRNLINTKIEIDCFVDTINIVYYSYKSGKLNNGGRFVPYEKDKENLSKNNKLINAKIVIYEQTETPEKIDKYYFMDTFSHEIAHAYRYYSILSQNNSNIPDSINKVNNEYKSAQKGIDYGDKAKKFIGVIVYLIDKDETSAYANQTYEELRQYTNINRENIQDHLNDFRMFRNITSLKEYLSNFDMAIKNKQKLESIRNALNEIYNTTYTNDKGIKLFRQRLVKEITKMSDQFIKVIEKGLMDFNRYNNFYREHFSERQLNLIMENFEI